MTSGASGATAAEIAKSIRVQACDFDADLCIGELALRLFGRESLAYGPPEQEEPARLVGTVPRIFVRRDLDNDELTDAIGDAVAVWWYRTREIQASSAMIEELSAALIEAGDLERPHRSGLHARFDVA